MLLLSASVGAPAVDPVPEAQLLFAYVNIFDRKHDHLYNGMNVLVSGSKIAQRLFRKP
jgi:hypothetical protein